MDKILKNKKDSLEKKCGICGAPYDPKWEKCKHEFHGARISACADCILFAKRFLFMNDVITAINIRNLRRQSGIVNA